MLSRLSDTHFEVVKYGEVTRGLLWFWTRALDGPRSLTSDARSR